MPEPGALTRLTEAFRRRATLSPSERTRLNAEVEALDASARETFNQNIDYVLREERMQGGGAELEQARTQASQRLGRPSQRHQPPRAAATVPSVGSPSPLESPARLASTPDIATAARMAVADPSTPQTPQGLESERGAASALMGVMPEAETYHVTGERPQTGPLPEQGRDMAFVRGMVTQPMAALAGNDWDDPSSPGYSFLARGGQGAAPIAGLVQNVAPGDTGVSGAVQRLAALQPAMVGTALGDNPGYEADVEGQRRSMALAQESNPRSNLLGMATEMGAQGAAGGAALANSGAQLAAMPGVHTALRGLAGTAAISGLDEAAGQAEHGYGAAAEGAVEGARRVVAPRDAGEAIPGALSMTPGAAQSAGRGWQHLSDLAAAGTLRRGLYGARRIPREDIPEVAALVREAAPGVPTPRRVDEGIARLHGQTGEALGEFYPRADRVASIRAAREVLDQEADRRLFTSMEEGERLAHDMMGLGGAGPQAGAERTAQRMAGVLNTDGGGTAAYMSPEQAAAALRRPPLPGSRAIDPTADTIADVSGVTGSGREPLPPPTGDFMDQAMEWGRLRANETYDTMGGVMRSPGYRNQLRAEILARTPELGGGVNMADDAAEPLMRRAAALRARVPERPEGMPLDPTDARMLAEAEQLEAMASATALRGRTSFSRGWQYRQDVDDTANYNEMGDAALDLAEAHRGAVEGAIRSGLERLSPNLAQEQAGLARRYNLLSRMAPLAERNRDLGRSRLDTAIGAMAGNTLRGPRQGMGYDPTGGGGGGLGTLLGAAAGSQAQRLLPGIGAGAAQGSANLSRLVHAAGVPMTGGPTVTAANEFGRDRPGARLMESLRNLPAGEEAAIAEEALGPVGRDAALNRAWHQNPEARAAVAGEDEARLLEPYPPQ